MNITTVVTSYNNDATIIETISSVLACTNGPDTILILDDCSQDSAVSDIAGKFSLELHVNSQNIGAIRTFNRCLEIAESDWIHILHADDCVSVDFYEAVRSMYNSDNSAVALCTRFRSGTELTESTFDKPMVTEVSILSDSDFLRDVPTGFCSTVFRRSLAQSIGGFDYSLVHVAELDMWLRLAREGKFLRDNRNLSFYRLDPKSDTGRLVTSGEIHHDYQRFYDKWVAIYPDKIRLFVYHYQGRMIAMTRTMMKSRRTSLALKNVMRIKFKSQLVRNIITKLNGKFSREV